MAKRIVERGIMLGGLSTRSDGGAAYSAAVGDQIGITSRTSFSDGNDFTPFDKKVFPRPSQYYETGVAAICLALCKKYKIVQNDRFLSFDAFLVV
jgi:hypothetical protein